MPHVKINSKFFIALTVKCEIIKLAEENIGEKSSWSIIPEHGPGTGGGCHACLFPTFQHHLCSPHWAHPSSKISQSWCFHSGSREASWPKGVIRNVDQPVTHWLLFEEMEGIWTPLGADSHYKPVLDLSLLFIGRLMALVKYIQISALTLGDSGPHPSTGPLCYMSWGQEYWSRLRHFLGAFLSWPRKPWPQQLKERPYGFSICGLD